ncbi:hypothetical protein [Bradyrhizobium sp. 63_E2_N1_3]|uniref:hypothetical protein n=1 Tax=Bradyrhizobium sp. 63_E2_N1_3 TaxID=3240373 RepID=UPI003F8B802A
MTAFILSATIAFALFELIAFTQWPPQGSFIEFSEETLGLQGPAARALRRMVQFLIVLVILLGVLTIHEVSSPFSTLARYEVNVIIGFIFGPLFAIWINSVVVHRANEDLTRGQMFAGAGLALLFLLGVLGGEGSGLIKQYARSLSSVKLGVAELSFASKEQGSRDRLASTTIPSASKETYAAGGPNGLQNLARLHLIIRRDKDYLTEIFTRRPQDRPVSDMPVDDLRSSETFTQSTIALPLQCLSAWFEQSADSGPVERYLASYSNVFRRLEALDRRAAARGPAIDPREFEAGLKQVSSDFVHNGLRMAVDIALSSTSPKTFEACKPWYDIYCPPNEKPASIDDDTYAGRCLRETLSEFTRSDGAARSDNVQDRLDYVFRNLEKMITPQPANRRGLETLPYFAIGRASLMTQAGQHEAAAAVLDNWLRERRETNSSDEQQRRYAANPMLQVRDEWFALRIRAMLVTYVEEWLEDQNSQAATIVRTEHLQNLQETIDGLKSRLLKVDFFQALNKQCPTTCPLTFKRPATCESDESQTRMKLWGGLYTSYVTMEYTYIHRALEHPDYAAKLAEAVNDAAHRLANFDMSCGTKFPEREVIYGQSLLGFAENAVVYTMLRAKLDDQVAQQKRLDEAERAVKLGMQVVDDLARIDRERSHRPYLERIAPSLAVSVQELLRQQLLKIEKARADLSG